MAAMLESLPMSGPGRKQGNVLVAMLSMKKAAFHEPHRIFIGTESYHTSNIATVNLRRQ